MNSVIYICTCDKYEFVTVMIFLLAFIISLARGVLKTIHLLCDASRRPVHFRCGPEKIETSGYGRLVRCKAVVQSCEETTRKSE